jgi:hypothetical protein
MRKIFIILAMVMGISIVGAAQESPAKVERNGKVFSQKSVKKAKTEPVVTDFQWEDSKGNQYPILVNPNSGRCFVIKVSGKTGKEYKQYLDADVCKAVCKEVGIAYVEKEGGSK